MHRLIDGYSIGDLMHVYNCYGYRGGEMNRAQDNIQQRNREQRWEGTIAQNDEMMMK